MSDDMLWIYNTLNLHGERRTIQHARGEIERLQNAPTTDHTVRITELESLLAEQDAQIAPLRDPEWEFAATLKLIAGQPGIDATSQRVLTELASRLPASDGERTP